MTNKLPSHIKAYICSFLDEFEVLTHETRINKQWNYDIVTYFIFQNVCFQLSVLSNYCQSRFPRFRRLYVHPYSTTLDHVISRCSSVTSVYLSSMINQIPSLPISTTYLAIYFDIQKDITYVFPPFVETLVFEGFFSIPLSNQIFPPSLTNLSFLYWDNLVLLPGMLSSSLQHLRLPYNFNQVLLPGVFPAGLRTLRFFDVFNQPLLPGVLPSSLRVLKLSYDFEQPLNDENLPSSLKELKIRREFLHVLSTVRDDLLVTFI